MTEELSELADGELRQGLDIRVGQVLADLQLRQTWSRYHLIGATMREEYSPLSADFCSRFEARLKDEPVVLCPRGPASNTAASPAANAGLRFWQSLALAASLAAIAMLSWHQFGNPVANRAGRDYLAQLPQNENWAPRQRTQKIDNLNIYLFEHGQYASVSDLNGLMAYTKFVSYRSGD